MRSSPGGLVVAASEIQLQKPITFLVSAPPATAAIVQQTTEKPVDWAATSAYSLADLVGSD